MSRARVTSSQVAERAGVSRSAVSRVFTPGASASAATIRKVREAADALGYRPNVLARAMVSGRSRIIGLVVAYLDNQFYPDALERLSNLLQGQGYHVLVFLAAKTMGQVDDIVEEILDYQPDGIILASVALGSELTQRCRDAGVPVVLFNRSQDDPNLSAVTTDNHAGGRAVARFLLARGHRRIGYIAGWAGASTQRDREAGFRAGLSEAGRGLDAHGVGDFRKDSAQEAARAMFAAPDRPDAVFVANDHMAFAVMDVLRFELGLSVPGDVALVGYDDVPLASWPAYDLTTMRQHAGQMAEHTVAILREQIESGETAPRRLSLPASLQVRGSAPEP